MDEICPLVSVGDVFSDGCFKKIATSDILNTFLDHLVTLQKVYLSEKLRILHELSKNGSGNGQMGRTNGQIDGKCWHIKR